MQYNLFIRAYKRIEGCSRNEGCFWNGWREYALHYLGNVSEKTIKRAMEYCIKTNNKNIAINIDIVPKNIDRPKGLGFEHHPAYTPSENDNAPCITLPNFSLSSICEGLSVCNGWKTESIKTCMTESIFQKFMENYKHIPPIVCSLNSFLWATDETTMSIIHNVCLHPIWNQISDMTQYKTPTH